MKRFLRLCVLGLYCLSTVVASAADARADFLKLIDRPRVPLAPEINALIVSNGIARFHFTYAAEAGQRVPGILLKAENSQGRRPVVIVLHGTGGNKNEQIPWLTTLAEKGFVAIAIDGRYHGERKTGRGTVEYENAIARAWSENGSREHPFYYDTVWDVMRLVDYLQTRDDVDASRIGLAGISKGGIETYLTAGIDQRIAVAVPFIGMQSFRWALDHNDWQGRIGTIQTAFNNVAKTAGKSVPDSAFVQQFYDRVVPGIYDEFDGPAMINLIAPRPLMVVNSDTDNHTPIPGVLLCDQAAYLAYQKANAEDHFVQRIQEHTGHQVTAPSQKAATGWFERWLQPEK